jgi:conserved oligomeric Golgi complex subunit 6
MEMKIKENIVDSRIKKVLQTRTDSALIMESLDTINDYMIHSGNTIETRRSLRYDLELQNLSYCQQFLSEYETVCHNMNEIDENIESIEQECHLMASKVTIANENMKLFMQKASHLEEKRNLTLTHCHNIEIFLQRFQLSFEEMNELYAFTSPSDTPMILTENFFTILKRLRSAYNDCKEMVELHQYNAGYELLDLLGQHQDKAYQKLFEWVKLRCDTTTATHLDTDDTILQTALNYLKEIPSYFLQCQELVISSRRSLIVQRFVLAVTQGQQSSSSSGGHPRSSISSSSRGLEMHSYDPVRFVGDMLAWVHQAIASEEEFLRAIFGSSSASAPLDDTPVTHTIPELMVRCLSGLGRPLKVRILQTFDTLRQDTNRHGVVIFFTLCDLIQFYSLTYQRIISPSSSPSALPAALDNSVQSAVRDCLVEGKKSFLSLLDKQSEQLKHATVSLFTMDTLSTITTKESCQLLQEVLRVFKSSMSLSQIPSLVTSPPSSSSSPASAAASSPTDGSGGGSGAEYDISINHVLERIIHPVLQSCRTSGNTAFVENNSDMAIFMLNNVCLLKVCSNFLLSLLPHRSFVSPVNSPPVLSRLCLL